MDKRLCRERAEPVREGATMVAGAFRILPSVIGCMVVSGTTAATAQQYLVDPSKMMNEMIRRSMQPRIPPPNVSGPQTEGGLSQWGERITPGTGRALSPEEIEQSDWISKHWYEERQRRLEQQQRQYEEQQQRAMQRPLPPAALALHDNRLGRWIHHHRLQLSGLEFEAARLKRFTAEDKGAYTVVIRGVPGAYFVQALEYDENPKSLVPD
jgi:hypothetical protein